MTKSKYEAQTQRPPATTEDSMETVILGACFNGFIVACAECEPDSPAFLKAKKAICDFYGSEKFFYANVEMLERMNKICGMQIEVQFGVPALPKRALKLA